MVAWIYIKERDIYQQHRWINWNMLVQHLLWKAMLLGLKGQAVLLQLDVFFNPIALRKAKIVCNFGLSEGNRDKRKKT